METKRLNGRIAIVTGASRRIGIGTAICRSLASEGADIFFTHFTKYDRSQPYGADEHWADALCSELCEYGVRVASMELDLSSPTAPNQLLDEVENQLGSPSILVNNATHCLEVDFRTISPDILDAHYAVNVRGTCLLSVEFARRLESGRGVSGKNGTGSTTSGRIINLVSGQDRGPMPGNLAYVATKGAVSAFTRSLSVELAPFGVTVNAIDPGPTDTGWMSEDLKAYLLPKFPMGRIGQPEDAARLITFLATDDAQWISGQVIHSDGASWV